jgi:hypothetical protein
MRCRLAGEESKRALATERGCSERLETEGVLRSREMRKREVDIGVERSKESPSETMASR